MPARQEKSSLDKRSVQIIKETALVVICHIERKTGRGTKRVLRVQFVVAFGLHGIAWRSLLHASQVT